MPIPKRIRTLRSTPTLYWKQQLSIQRNFQLAGNRFSDSFGCNTCFPATSLIRGKPRRVARDQDSAGVFSKQHKFGK